jgi:hypothetical protein
MILGQSAGCAAAMAVHQQTTVQEVDYDELRQKLLEANQILTIPENWLDYVLSEKY